MIMATVNMKKTCPKCSNGAGVATCDGCQQSFCIKHFGEHRQELSQQMENVGQEHDRLQQDLDQQNTEHPLYVQIALWEQESITKIQVTAEAVRADLRELLDENKKELKKSVAKITDELQSCRKMDDYTEIDINKWTQQLQALRKILDSSSTISIAENDTPDSVIHLIRERGQQQDWSSDFSVGSLQHRVSPIRKLNSSCNERFDETVGKAITSEENRVITRNSEYDFVPSRIYGTNRYSSGTHHIHFRIEKIGDLRSFFGITTSFEKTRTTDARAESLYGWWDLVKVVVNSKVQKEGHNQVIRTGDEMTLTLDCDNRQIQLQHYRTNRLLQLFIDINNCPFPWKVVLQLKSNSDSIRIL